MRLTLMGKLVALIVAVGAAVGGWRLWQRSGGSGAGSGPGFSVPGLPPLPGGKAGGVTEIPFVITAAKKDWVQEQIDRFNAEHRGQWQVVARPIPSREAMHAILDGKERPVLWSPGSPIWPTRLAEAWPKDRGGAILDMSDPDAYRVFLRSPLVILTTREKARTLRPLLSGPRPWAALRKLSLGTQRVPWGAFRFSHADPLTSSSGMLTLALIMLEYGQDTGRLGQLDRVATDPRFIGYLRELEHGLVYDAPAEKGTTALTKAFVEDTRRYDLITAYESAALEAAGRDRNLAVIYPSPTAVSEHAASLLSGDWVTREQREGAQRFLQFLGGKEAIRSGMDYHFRPAQASSSLSLASELSRYQEQGFQQSFTTAELPPYEALNAAAFQWRVQVARKPLAPGERK